MEAAMDQANTKPATKQMQTLSEEELKAVTGGTGTMIDPGGGDDGGGGGGGGNLVGGGGQQK
jgi:bacteriocin-like protein